MTGRNGHIFIISAPSGAGKTTLCRALRDAYPDIVYSVSHTTRPRRKNETDGVDYRFTTRTTFESGIARGQWAEWAKVHGHYYGTSAAALDEALAEGRDVLLDIDVQGTRQLLERYPDSVTIFIAPPSMDALRRRLEHRRADAPEVIEKRLAAADAEIAQQHLYRHVIVNDRLADAIAALQELVGRYRRSGRGRP